jgi:hypothetical protein
VRRDPFSSERQSEILEVISASAFLPERPRMKRILLSADFQSGVMFLVIAGLGFWLVQGLRLGTAMRMGPGYMPVLLSGILLVLGLGTLLSAVIQPGERTGRWVLRPLAAVLMGLLIFALGIERLGLFAGIVLLVVCASFATRESRWIEVLLVAFGLAAFSTALFVGALSLPIPPWPQALLPT